MPHYPELSLKDMFAQPMATPEGAKALGPADVDAICSVLAHSQVSSSLQLSIASRAVALCLRVVLAS